MQEPHWICRPIEPENTLKGWVRKIPGDKWGTELPDGTQVHILERRGKGVKVSDPSLRRHHLKVDEVDCGHEWRVTSDWLSESHPRVLAMLQERMASLRSTPLGQGESEGRRAERVAYIVWVLQRNGIQAASP